jgi:hypothetical protein
MDAKGTAPSAVWEESDPDRAAAEEETAAAQRLIHELAANEIDRKVLFRFYVAGEDEARIRGELDLSEAQYDRIQTRAQQRFKEMLRTAHTAGEEKGTGEHDHLDSHPDIEAALRRGLTQLAARQASGEVTVRKGLIGHLRSPAAIFGLLAILFAAIAAASLLELRAHRLRMALDRTRITSPPRPIAPAAALEAQLRQAREALDQERLRGADRLEKERRQRGALTADLERLRRPQINNPLVPLSRDEPSERSILSLPPNPSSWIVLSLDLEGAAKTPTYRATLTRPKGGELWSSSGLTANRWGSLVISLPAALLKPGSYQIRVEAVPLNGAPQPVGRFGFQVSR